MTGKRKFLLLAMATASLTTAILIFNIPSPPERYKPKFTTIKTSNMEQPAIKDTNNAGASLRKKTDIQLALQAMPNGTVNVTDANSVSSRDTSNYIKNFAKFFEMDVQTDIPDRLLNEHRFEFTLNTKACRGDELLVTLIHTAVDHFDSRLRIRNTWGSVKDDVTLVAGPIFLIGQISSTNDELQEKIDQESAEYGDIVQGNFDDTYRNLTYKNIMGLHWIRHYCNRTKFVLKVDDDVLVNIDGLLDHLKTMKGIDTNFIWCTYFPKIIPFRSASKFQLTLEDYPLKVFPPYCRGWFYVMSNDVTAKLYDASKTVRYFWIDDVFITGALTLKAGIRISPSSIGSSLLEPNVKQAGRTVFYLAKPIELLKNWQPTWDMIRSINNRTRVGVK